MCPSDESPDIRGPDGDLRSDDSVLVDKDRGRRAVHSELDRFLIFRIDNDRRPGLEFTVRLGIAVRDNDQIRVMIGPRLLPLLDLRHQSAAMRAGQAPENYEGLPLGKEGP